MDSIARYPIIEVPFSLKTALTAIPQPPQEPVKPAFPVHPMLPSLFTRGIVGWLLVIMFGGSWLLDQHLELAAAFLTGVALLAILRGKCRVRSHYIAQVAQYEIDFGQYLGYPERQAAYEEALLHYARPNTLPLYREQQVTSLLRRITLCLYSIPPDEVAPRQGRSETYFLAYLQQSFGKKTIYTQCRVPVDDPRLATAWYYPDFIYLDATGLCINIEIDEPYALRTKEPIHYQGQDDARNAYFLRKHWVVVRFTEEQVVRYPKQCCKELAELIFSLTGTHYAAKFFPQSLSRVAQWSQQQALQQARADTRKTYLGLLSRGVA